MMRKLELCVGLVILFGLTAACSASGGVSSNSVTTTNAISAYPKVGDIWAVAVEFNICGEELAPLPADPAAAETSGTSTIGGGIIEIEPKTSREVGKNVTFGNFVSQYPGLRITTKELDYPAELGTQGETHWTNGGDCPTGTKYSGRSGRIQVDLLESLSDPYNDLQLVSDPDDLRLLNEQIIVVSFDPTGFRPQISTSLIELLLKTENSIGVETGQAGPSVPS